jgi:hypothetical protein
MRNKYRFILVLSIITTLFYVQCNDTFDPVEVKCKNLKLDPEKEYKYQHISDNIPFTPCYNPNSADEIIFVERKNGNNSFFITKLDLITHEKFYLHETQFLDYAPKWGRNDFILMAIRGNIWIVKSNGDSLTQLTLDGNNYNPNWSYDASSIYCGKVVNVQGSQQKIGVVMDISGVIKDSLSSWGPANTNHPKYSIYVGPDLGPNLIGLSIRDVKMDTSGVVATFNPSHNCYGFDWLNDETIIWSKYDGVYLTNIKSGNTSFLFENCDNKIYNDLTFHPQNGKVIFVKTIYEFVKKKDLIEISDYLVQMNPDGSDEKVLAFD